MKLGLLDEPRFWNRLTVMVTALAIAKGLRFPNLWAATQLQLGYQFGLVKRGAAGAALHALRIPINHYWVFAAVAFSILLLAVAAAVVFVRRHAVGFDAWTWIPVFASSFAVTYVVHLVGYLDLILLTVTLIALLLPRTVLDYALCVCGMLIHEEFLLMFFPLLWFGWVLEARRGRGSWASGNVLGLPLFVFGLAVLLAAARPMSAEQVSLAHQTIVAAADFPVRADFFEVMQRSLADNVHVMVGEYRKASWWLDELGASLALLWVAVFFAWRSWRVLAVANDSLLKAALLCVAFAPAFIQLNGMDLYRWYAFTAVSSFVAYMLVVSRFAAAAAAAPADSERSRTWVLLLVALNLSTGAGMLDDRSVNNLPFIDPVKALIKTTVQLGHLPIPMH